MTTSIYLVETPSGERLVEATTKQVAINFAVKSTVTARPVTAVQLAEKLRAGMTIEKASNIDEPTAQDAAEDSADGALPA